MRNPELVRLLDEEIPRLRETVKAHRNDVGGREWFAANAALTDAMNLRVYLGEETDA